MSESGYPSSVRCRRLAGPYMPAGQTCLAADIIGCCDGPGYFGCIKYKLPEGYREVRNSHTVVHPKSPIRDGYW